MFLKGLPKVPGTKKQILRNQLLISSGISSLDSILGGGIPIGSLILLEDEEFGGHSKTLLKYYLSEGIFSNHAVALASRDVDTTEFINHLPAPLSYYNYKEANNSSNIDELSIAWRYKNLSNCPSNVSNVFGNTYDLNTLIEKSVLQNVNVKFWDSESDDVSYNNLFVYIESIIKDLKFNLNTSVETRTVLRIALLSLNSILWEGDLVKFLVRLRFLLQNTCSCCFITVSSCLFESKQLATRCEHLCDIVICLKSLNDKGGSAYNEYEGLLIVKKLPVINSWNSYIPDNNDWAFKVKKTSFLIEKLHISPELKENVHREEESVSSEYIIRKSVDNIAYQF